MPLALGVGAAAGHLAGSVRQGLGRRWAAVVLLVVGSRISLSSSDAEPVSRDSLHSPSLPAELRHTKPQQRSFYRNAGLTASWNPFSQ